MKKFFVMHPFLLVLFPILFLFSHNIEESRFEDIIHPSVIAILFIFLLQFLLTIIFLRPESRQSGKKKVALIISLFLIVFFSYSYLHIIFEGFTVAGVLFGRDRYIYVILLLIFVSGLYLIIRTKNNLDNLTRVINIAASALILISLANIVAYELKGSSPVNNVAGSEIEQLKHSTKNTDDLPDIYYVILDGYGNTEIMKEYYNYDNSEFVNFLVNKGFYVTTESRSNYAETLLSLASSLNMTQLPGIGKTVDVPMLYQYINNNKVMKLFGSLGYKTVNISSNIGKMEHVKIADYNITCGNFLTNEFYSTLIRFMLPNVLWKYLNLQNLYRDRILCTFSELSNIKKRIPDQKPLFVFAHILPPHPPFVFGPNAEPVKDAGLSLREWGHFSKEMNEYKNQLIFVNKMMKKVVTNIMTNSGDNAIIILQSDHGPHQVKIDKYKVRLKIFNAFLLPKKFENFFYNTMTPVNTFRIIFDKYFKMNYKLLEDKSYYTEYNIPYNFLDVTEEISNKAK